MQVFIGHVLVLAALSLFSSLVMDGRQIWLATSRGCVLLLFVEFEFAKEGVFGQSCHTVSLHMLLPEPWLREVVIREKGDLEIRTELLRGARLFLTWTSGLPLGSVISSSS